MFSYLRRSPHRTFGKPETTLGHNVLVSSFPFLKLSLGVQSRFGSFVSRSRLLPPTPLAQSVPLPLVMNLYVKPITPIQFCQCLVSLRPSILISLAFQLTSPLLGPLIAALDRIEDHCHREIWGRDQPRWLHLRPLHQHLQNEVE